MKNKKVIEKSLACKSVLKFQICSGKKSKKVENKYGIRTDLPSARARRFESDERDLSPAVITTARIVLENWTRTSLRPHATPSLHIFSGIV